MSDSIKNKILVTLFQIPWVKARWESKFQAVASDGIPWTPLQKPLNQCKIAILTTGGVHLKEDQPFDMKDKHGDPTYRKIPSKTTQDQLSITHDYYDHSDADQDINLVFPIEILKECLEEGILGSSAEIFYSFMGHIEEPHLETLINKTSKEVAKALARQNVDIAVLVPA